MKFTVELLAFGKPGEIREVDVPANDDHDYPEVHCSRVFYHGQNEVQPQDHPSVSAGDVIHIGEDRWLIMAVGFHKLTTHEYEAYKSMNQRQRIPIQFAPSQPAPHHKETPAPKHQRRPCLPGHNPEMGA